MEVKAAWMGWGSMHNHAQDEEIERWLVTWKYTRVRFRYSCSSAGLDKAHKESRQAGSLSAGGLQQEGLARKALACSSYA